MIKQNAIEAKALQKLCYNSRTQRKKSFYRHRKGVEMNEENMLVIKNKEAKMVVMNRQKKTIAENKNW